jgi:prevent-host-death family protein
VNRNVVLLSTAALRTPTLAETLAALPPVYMTTIVTSEGGTMREIQLREAKVALSAVVDEAVRDRPSVITRHGKPEAAVLSFEEWERLSRVPSFGRLLMAAPVEPENLPERDRAPIRQAEF